LGEEQKLIENEETMADLEHDFEENINKN